jgi:hypothetical protein
MDISKNTGMDGGNYLFRYLAWIVLYLVKLFPINAMPEF